MIPKRYRYFAKEMLHVKFIVSEFTCEFIVATVGCVLKVAQNNVMGHLFEIYVCRCTVQCNWHCWFVHVNVK